MSKPNWDAWEDAMEERDPRPAPTPAQQQTVFTPPTVPKLADPPKPAGQPAQQQPAKPVDKPPSAWELKQKKMNAAVRQYQKQEEAWHRFRSENSGKAYQEE